MNRPKHYSLEAKHCYLFIYSFVWLRCGEAGMPSVTPSAIKVHMAEEGVGRCSLSGSSGLGAEGTWVDYQLVGSSIRLL